ncbi:MAG: hypothetical protein JWN70_6068 [Planctomycetaceae bacterium]|nr:hypothetical protein [Planctomycetaceae bacterium]
MLGKVLFAIMVAIGSPAIASDLIVKISIPGDGAIRIQRFETTFVASDQFAGLFNDSLMLSPGQYRFQAFPESQPKRSLLFFDVDVAEDGVVAKLENRARVASLVHGGERVWVARVEPVIDTGTTVTTISLSNLDGIALKNSNLLPFTESTAWSEKSFQGNGRRKVNVTSSPEGAEIWLNGKKQSFRTNKAFFVPADDIMKARDSLVIRKPGYANVIVPLAADGEPIDLNLSLTKAE